jgi:hypothetical protein
MWRAWAFEPALDGGDHEIAYHLAGDTGVRHGRPGDTRTNDDFLWLRTLSRALCAPPRHSKPSEPIDRRQQTVKGKKGSLLGAQRVCKTD